MAAIEYKLKLKFSAVYIFFLARISFATSLGTLWTTEGTLEIWCLLKSEDPGS